MKKIIFSFSLLFISLVVFSQDVIQRLPEFELKDMNGKAVKINELTKTGPVVISFWATWCAPCKRELEAIDELYVDWKEETNVTVVAVSIDDEKTKARVPAYVNGKGWDFVVLMDPNGDFKRTMGVNNVPHTFLVDKNGKIVYTHNSYAPGDENALYQELLKVK
jgi:peroxiredoxin